MTRAQLDWLLVFLAVSAGLGIVLLTGCGIPEHCLTEFTEGWEDAGCNPDSAQAAESAEAVCAQIDTGDWYEWGEAACGGYGG